MNFWDPEGWEAHEARMAGPWPDDEVTEVDDTDACAYFDAADGGEETEDMEGRDFHPDPGFPWESKLAMLLDEATDLQLKAARYALEREEKKRLEHAQATIRALDPNAPKPRATRKDKGTTRKPANEVLRDEKGVAV